MYRLGNSAAYLATGTVTQRLRGTEKLESGKSASPGGNPGARGSWGRSQAALDEADRSTAQAGSLGWAFSGRQEAGGSGGTPSLPPAPSPHPGSHVAGSWQRLPSGQGAVRV